VLQADANPQKRSIGISLDVVDKKLEIPELIRPWISLYALYPLTSIPGEPRIMPMNPAVMQQCPPLLAAGSVG